MREGPYRRAYRRAAVITLSALWVALLPVGGCQQFLNPCSDNDDCSKGESCLADESCGKCGPESPCMEMTVYRWSSSRPSKVKVYCLKGGKCGLCSRPADCPPEVSCLKDGRCGEC